MWRDEPRTAYRYYDPVSFRSGGRQVLTGAHPLVFAHRGGARLAPENTMAAFERGLASGADGIECDVHLSRDGIPVVIHDATLDRTTNTTGSVCLKTASELTGIDAGCRFQQDEAFPYRDRGACVPTLEQVLRLAPDKWTIIEMKTGDAALGRAVVDVVRRLDAIDRVCVGSFHRHSVEAVRKEEPAIATSACEWEARWTLYRSWIRWPAFGNRPYSAFQVPEMAGKMRVVSPQFVKQVHGEGATVQVWVVDRPDDIKRLFDWGVDGVISDRPDLAVAARDEWVKASRR